MLPSVLAGRQEPLVVFAHVSAALIEIVQQLDFWTPSFQRLDREVAVR
jgi:hypothetical protein